MNSGHFRVWPQGPDRPLSSSELAFQLNANWAAYKGFETVRFDPRLSCFGRNSGLDYFVLIDTAELEINQATAECLKLARKMGEP